MLTLNEDLFDDVVIMEVPDAISGTPAVNTSGVPDMPQLGEDIGIANELSALIRDEWEAIEGYNNMLANLGSHQDMADAIKDIANEENNHVGILQQLLSRISPNAASIAEGEAEAMNESLKESITPSDKTDINNYVKSCIENIYNHFNGDADAYESLKKVFKMALDYTIDEFDWDKGGIKESLTESQYDVPEIESGDLVGFGTDDATEYKVTKVEDPYIYFEATYSKYPNEDKAHRSNISIIRRDGNIIYKSNRYIQSEDDYKEINKLNSNSLSKYFAMMEYVPGSPEDGMEGDDFFTLDVVKAANEEEATKLFNNPDIGNGSIYVTEIDKERYDNFYNNAEDSWEYNSKVHNEGYIPGYGEMPGYHSVDGVLRNDNMDDDGNWTDDIDDDELEEDIIKMSPQDRWNKYGTADLDIINAGNEDTIVSDGSDDDIEDDMFLWRYK